MKYLVIFLTLTLTACTSTPEVSIESDLYTYSHNEKGDLTSKVKLNSKLLRPGTDSAVLVLQTSKAQVSSSGRYAYYPTLIVWYEQIEELIAILSEFINRPLDAEPTRIAIKLGPDQALLSTNIINSELYVFIVSVSGVLNLSRDNVVELIKILKEIKSVGYSV